jgi:hypothetical protein
MNCVIVFRQGHSGHFLLSVILNYPASAAKFRMSDYHQTLYPGIHLTHNPDVTKHPGTAFRILPTDKIYQAIYNIFMKKILLEEFPNFDLANWVNDPVFWYDKCYYHIAESYNNIQQDLSTNTISNVIDFDRLTDTVYIAEWFRTHFSIELNSNQLELIENYAKLQLNVNLTNKRQTDIEEILSPITDQMLLENPWFWAYTVFKYEHDNNLTEHQRLWSVDDISAPQTIADIKQYKYQVNLLHL